MNVLITIIISISLFTICMLYIVNLNNTNKKQEKKILYIYGELNNFRNEIWGLKHPPKYKIGDKVKFNSTQKNSLLVRGIRLHCNMLYPEDFYQWEYQLDDGNPKYEPKWYNESSIHI